MGLFSKIFASKKEEETKEKNQVIRAQFKDYEFFEKELKFNAKVLETFRQDDLKLLENGGELLPSHYDGTFGYLNKRSNLLYSAGVKVSDIKPTFDNAYENYIKSLDDYSEMYSNFLSVISKAILFNFSKEKIHQLSDFVITMNHNKNLEIWEPDKIIGFLIHSQIEGFEIPNSVLFPQMYAQLEKVIDADSSTTAEKEMSIYLEKWYDLHKSDPWYDNHKKQRGYSGYWCWEAAAVVNIMKLDDSSFKDNPYYPYDMVHWQD